MKKRLIKSILVMGTTLFCVVTMIFAWYIGGIFSTNKVVVITGDAKDAISAKLYIGNDWDFDGRLDKYFDEYNYEIPMEEQCMSEINENFYTEVEKNLKNTVSGIYEKKIITYKFVLENTSDIPIYLSFFLMGLQKDINHKDEPIMFRIGNIKIIDYAKWLYEDTIPMYDFEWFPEDYNGIIYDGRNGLVYNLWGLKNNEEYLDLSKLRIPLVKDRIFEIEFQLECLALTDAALYYNNYFLGTSNSNFTQMRINTTDQQIINKLNTIETSVRSYLQNAYNYVDNLKDEEIAARLLDNSLIEFNNLDLNELETLDLSKEANVFRETMLIEIESTIVNMLEMSIAIRHLIGLLGGTIMNPDVMLNIEAFGIHATWVHS